MMQKRGATGSKSERDDLTDWNVKILTVSQTSFKVNKFGMVDKVFVGTGKVGTDQVGAKQRIIAGLQDEV
ncbi:unnamed protein product [Bathycoccus prasinos]